MLIGAKDYIFKLLKVFKGRKVVRLLGQIVEKVLEPIYKEYQQLRPSDAWRIPETSIAIPVYDFM